MITIYTLLMIKRMQVPIDIVYEIVNHLSIQDLNKIKLVSRSFYGACNQKRIRLKEAFHRVLTSKSCNLKKFKIYKDDEDIYSIAINNKKYARIEYKRVLKIYDMDIFASDDWINILGTLFNHIGVSIDDVDRIDIYKSNVYVLLYKGRIKLL